MRLSRQLGLAAVCVVAALSTQARADWYAATWFGTNGGNNDGENAVSTRAPNAGGTFALADWVDPGAGQGGPQDFNVNNPFPGNTAADDNNYSMYASGVLHVVNAGTYTFRTGTDDSSRLIVDGRNVVIQNGCCADVNGPPSGGLTLSAGVHRIQVSYNEGGGGSNGEFSVSNNASPGFQLLGQGAGAHPDMFVDQNVTKALPVAFNQGLVGKYFELGGSNQNAVTDAFLAGSPTPKGTFHSTDIDYHNFSNLSNTLTNHLNSSGFGDGGTLTAGGSDNADDSLITLSGFIKILAGDDLDPSTPGIQVTFHFGADDNARLVIAGETLIENDGSHGAPHFLTDNTDTLAQGTGDNASGVALMTFPSEGNYSLFAFYHNGGGGYEAQLLSSIGRVGDGAMLTVDPSRLFQNVIPEPATLGLFGLAGLALVRRRK
jgi:hypothetical protein